MPEGDALNFELQTALLMCRLRNWVVYECELRAIQKRAEQHDQKEDAAAGKDQRDAIVQTRIRK